MNRKLIFIMGLVIFSSIQKTNGQITLDTIVHPWNLIGYDFYPVKISEGETKYYVQDTLTNSFNLYNLDFTPFLQNISVPESYSPFTKNMEVIYLSRTLFDCDSTNIEYAYTAIGSGYNPFYIMRTDGTQLFKLDSALAPWSLGTLNGSQDIRPIINTESGSKLFLYYPRNTNNLHIYSLCGNLVSGFYSLLNHVENSTMVQIFPNPSSGILNLLVNIPDNLNEYFLTITDIYGIEIYRQKIEFGSGNYSFDVSKHSSGIYFYNIYINGIRLNSNKFIITK